MIRRILEAIAEKEFTPTSGVVEPEGFEPPFLAYVSHPPGINYGMTEIVPKGKKNALGFSTDIYFGTAREAADAAKAAAAELGYGAGWHVQDGKGNIVDEVPAADEEGFSESVAEREFTPRGDVLEPTPTGKWVDEFGPEYAVPKEVLEHPLMKDMSWHNDSAPSFGRFEDSNSILVRLWVEHPDPEQREFGPEANRFGVQASAMGNEDPLEVLPEYGFQTDDLAEAIAMFEKAYQAYFS